MVFGVEGQPLCEKCSSSIKIDDLLTPGWEYKGDLSDAEESAAVCGLCSLVWKGSQVYIPRSNHELPAVYSLKMYASDDTLPISRALRVDIDWPGSSSK
jgi:hypothetical protein